MQAHSLRILDREMPEAADPRNRDPFSRPRLCLFSPCILISPAQDRRDVRKLGAFVKPHSEVGGGNEILGESPLPCSLCSADLHCLNTLEHQPGKITPMEDIARAAGASP